MDVVGQEHRERPVQLGQRLVRGSRMLRMHGGHDGRGRRLHRGGSRFRVCWKWVVPESKETLDDVGIGARASDVDVLTLTNRTGSIRGPKRFLRPSRSKLNWRHLGEALNHTGVRFLPSAPRRVTRRSVEAVRRTR